MRGQKLGDFPGLLAAFAVLATITGIVSLWQSGVKAQEPIEFTPPQEVPVQTECLEWKTAKHLVVDFGDGPPVLEVRYRGERGEDHVACVDLRELTGPCPEEEP